MPFTLNFESRESIDTSDFDPNAWQVVDEGGQNLLIGKARASQPFVVVGRGVPEWVEPDKGNVVISMRFNLEANEGARLVFRYTPGVGYNVLELIPGRMLLKRNARTADPRKDRFNEIVMQQANVPLRLREWYTVTVWTEGQRIAVYLDGDLVLQREDLNTPQLGAGLIMLQTDSAFSPVRFDLLTVQLAERGSQHFEASDFPQTWLRDNSQRVTIQRESNGNGYLYLNGEAQTAPVMPSVSDFALRYRVWSEEGGYRLILRESPERLVQLTFVGGDIAVNVLDGTGASLTSQTVRNAYTRGLWQNFAVTWQGERLTIVRDGKPIFEERMPLLPAGTLRFATRGGDKVRIDGVLLTQSAGGQDADVIAAVQLRDRTLQRDFRLLRSDLDEPFDDIFRTSGWWVNGRDATGQFLTDPAARTNQNFLRMTHLGAPTFRLFKDSVGVEMFGAGRDTRNFRDSTDLLVQVQVRFPTLQAGEAWVSLRATPTLAGRDVLGYRVTLAQDVSSGTPVLRLRVDYQSETELVNFFDDLVPSAALGTPAQPNAPMWINLTLLTYRDRFAVFVGERLLVTFRDERKFGGTLALGVNEGTVADFDTLILRDTSPHGE